MKRMHIITLALGMCANGLSAMEVAAQQAPPHLRIRHPDDAALIARLERQAAEHEAAAAGHEAAVEALEAERDAARPTGWTKLGWAAFGSFLTIAVGSSIKYGLGYLAGDDSDPTPDDGDKDGIAGALASNEDGQPTEKSVIGKILDGVPGDGDEEKEDSNDDGDGDTGIVSDLIGVLQSAVDGRDPVFKGEMMDISKAEGLLGALEAAERLLEDQEGQIAE